MKRLFLSFDKMSTFWCNNYSTACHSDWRERLWRICDSCYESSKHGAPRSAAPQATDHIPSQAKLLTYLSTSHDDPRHAACKWKHHPPNQSINQCLFVDNNPKDFPSDKGWAKAEPPCKYMQTICIQQLHLCPSTRSFPCINHGSCQARWSHARCQWRWTK